MLETSFFCPLLKQFVSFVRKRKQRSVIEIACPLLDLKTKMDYLHSSRCATVIIYEPNHFNMKNLQKRNPHFNP